MAIRGRRRGLAASLGLAVLLWATGRPAGPALAAGAGVTIANFAYTPAQVTIAAGQSVLWTMGGDPEQHTVTPDVTGAFTGSGILDSGQTFQVTFETPGTYPYHCQLHPFMKGTVVVIAGSGTPTPTAAPTPTPRPSASPTPRPSTTPTPRPSATSTSPIPRPTTAPRPTPPESPAPEPAGSGPSSPPTGPPTPVGAGAGPSSTAAPSPSLAGPSGPGGSSGDSAPGHSQEGEPDRGPLLLLAGLGAALVVVWLLARFSLARR
ncbi:MAG: cupredoxin domain-containing protein [Chloroflexota bacterium]